MNHCLDYVDWLLLNFDVTFMYSNQVPKTGLYIQDVTSVKIYKGAMLYLNYKTASPITFCYIPQIILELFSFLTVLFGLLLTCIYIMVFFCNDFVVMIDVELLSWFSLQVDHGC